VVVVDHRLWEPRRPVPG